MSTKAVEHDHSLFNCSSRLDIGNALLHRLRCHQLQWLQRVQNWADRILVGATTFCYATRDTAVHRSKTPKLSHQALTLSFCNQWPGGPVDFKIYLPPAKVTGPDFFSDIKHIMCAMHRGSFVYVGPICKFN